jgi:hypothetical protein
MDWLDHPRYVGARNRVIKVFRGKKHNFERLKHIVFLCGGHGSARRDRVAEYLRRWHEEVLVFYADDAWRHVAELADKDSALDVEEKFAALADVVIVVVESAGTFTELGAFSMQCHVRKKLLPILDIAYKDDESFINTGPVRWIDRESMFAPSLYVDFSVVLMAAGELSTRLSRLPPTKRHKVENVAESPKHVVFLLRDVVAVTGPVTRKQLEFYLQEILGNEVPHFHHLIGLAVALRLIRPVSALGETAYVVCEQLTSPFTRKRHLNVNAERSKLLSVMQTIPEARSALASAAS